MGGWKTPSTEAYNTLSRAARIHEAVVDINKPNLNKL